PARQTETVPSGTAPDLEDTCAWLGIEHIDHQFADRLFILIKGRELPVQRSVVNALRNPIILALGLRLDLTQFGRPEEIRHAVLDGETSTIGREQIIAFHAQLRARFW